MAEPIAVPHTVFFDTCLAVFQGGGCRAAAFAGAYEAAYEAGVHFSEVAGTSAGSIIAALIGAGGRPGWVREQMKKLDFPSLIKPPRPQDGFPGAIPRAMARGGALLLRCTPWAIMGPVLRFGGAYSSGELETWMNKLLRELLPQAKDPVRFGDLLMPTYVVATDLASGGPRVWSTDETATASVAFAVRASCSIPIFFQAVAEGDSRLVDGGVLSNLPVFVFSPRGRMAHQPHGRRILAFRLREEPAPRPAWDPRSLGKRLLEVAIDGATELQVGMRQEVHSVYIPTGTIRATDFDTITPSAIQTLVDSGRKATFDFIHNEVTYLQQSAYETAQFQDSDQVLLEVVQQSESPAEEILVSDVDSVWFWKLFPTVLHWCDQGTRVRVLLQDAGGSTRDRARENTRRRNLAGLGVEVHGVPELPFRGYVFWRNDPHGAAAVIFRSQEDQYAPLAVRYGGRLHPTAIAALRDMVLRAMPAADPPQTLAAPRLEAFSEPSLLGMLRQGVSQYSRQGVDLRFEDVEVGKVRSLTQLIRAYKYRQIVRYAELFRRSSLPLFGTAAVALVDGTSSIAAPPVVEVHGSNFIGVEGNTRTYYCHREGIDRMRCVVVRNLQDPPPGTSVAPDRVSLINSDLPPQQRLPGFQYSQFRRIEGAVHPILPLSANES